jgi:hypothetical protein
MAAIEHEAIHDHVSIASRHFIGSHNHANYEVQDDFSGPEMPPMDRLLSSRPVRRQRSAAKV